MKKLNFIILIILSGLFCNAQTEKIELFSEIVAGSDYSAVPEFFEWTEKGLVIFAADDAEHGTELWVSDGTTEGTHMVKDIFPGTGDYEDPYSSYPEFFCAMGDFVYFRAFSEGFGFELYRTDGTEEGTSLVADITPGASGGMAQSNPFCVYNNELYFQAKGDITTGVELWKSDGTSEGTVMVKDINPTSQKSSQPRNFVNFNGLLFFIAETIPDRPEIWSSDGTGDGTQRLSTLPVEESLRVFELTVCNNLLFFKASGEYDLEMYVSDGTFEGTFLLKDINTEGGSMPQLEQMIVFNNELYFQANSTETGSELWKSDGTSEGTVLVKDINPLFDYYAQSSYPAGFAVFDNKLFFRATDGTHGYELWMTDGTEEGTVMYSEINPEAGNSSPNNLTVCNGRLYFNATDAEDNKLMSLGSATDAVTVHTSDEFEYSGSSGFISFFVINDRLHFHALLESDKGWELYKLVEDDSNSTFTATENKVNIYPNPAGSYIIIETPGSDFSAQIISVDGALIKTVKNEKKTDLTDLSSGIYILDITTTAGIHTYNKIIKE